jgi:hypothetical protein
MLLLLLLLLLNTDTSLSSLPSLSSSSSSSSLSSSSSIAAGGLVLVVATGPTGPTWAVQDNNSVVLLPPQPFPRIVVDGIAGNVWENVVVQTSNGTVGPPWPVPDGPARGGAVGAAATWINVSGLASGPPGSFAVWRVFELFPDFPGFVRSHGLVSRVSGTVLLTDYEVAAVTLAPGLGGGTTGDAALLHMGQRGHMPLVTAVTVDKPGVRLQTGCYPSSQEDLSSTAWLAMQANLADGSTMTATVGLAFNGKTTTTVWCCAPKKKAGGER